MNRFSRTGFTLVELLVVVAVIGILTGLLLAAVQRVRERLAGAQSQNNLRQIALACHLFHDAHRGRMPGTGTTVDADGDPILFFDLLPYIEQTPVYNEFTIGPGGVIILPDSLAAGPAHIIPVYISPADGSNPSQLAAGRGATSYAANRGVFLTGSSFRRTFRDGMSNTILLSERLMQCGSVPNVWFSFGPKQLVFSAAPFPANYAPTVEICDPDRCSSPHSTGINVSMADGSVRFVSRQAAVENWVLACDPEDGSPFTPTW